MGTCELPPVMFCASGLNHYDRECIMVHYFGIVLDNLVLGACCPDTNLYRNPI